MGDAPDAIVDGEIAAWVVRQAWSLLKYLFTRAKNFLTPKRA